MSDHLITVRGHVTSETAFIIWLAPESATQIFKGSEDRMEVDISGSMICGLPLFPEYFALPSNGLSLW